MSGVNAFWREPKSLVLASKSSARAALLKQTGIPFITAAAKIDERTVEGPRRQAGATAREIAAHLATAKAKAAAVAPQHRDHLVLGADQTLALGDRMFTKPAHREEALEQLRALSGGEHELHSAICLMRAEDILFETVETAHMKMRVLGEPFLTAYASEVGPALTASVGAYQVEGLGIHLFDSIAGDHSTILGLPLIPLLAFLRRNGSLLG
ncbi:MAG: nucleoside triphosphate pyrophosphatase [Methylobacteriaceae bacterium]|jgi:septum formation protein|nr:nucleoside triphosphate pyrophosphatase [Methylobacteriaceae bacterium]